MPQPRSGGSRSSSGGKSQSRSGTSRRSSTSASRGKRSTGGRRTTSRSTSSARSTQGSAAPAAADAQFWPAASLLNQLGLTTVPDPQYVSDAPQPLQLRAITATTRRVGALQSAP